MATLTFNLNPGNSTSLAIENLPGNINNLKATNYPGNSSKLISNNLPGNNKKLNIRNSPGNNKELKVNNMPGNTARNIIVNVEMNNFFISGRVTANTAAVVGAKVYLIDEINDNIVEVAYTDENGYYKFEHLNPDRTFHVVTSWKDDQNNMYNAKSKPFVSPSF